MDESMLKVVYAMQSINYPRTIEVLPPGACLTLREGAGAAGLSVDKVMVDTSDLFVIFGL
jgi:hypothetical protein